MARTSQCHYIAPSAVSITPNANNSANDLAVYVAKGAKIKVHSEGIPALKDMPNGTWQEWTMSGRNRRLNTTYADQPFTIYARLLKNGEKTGYLVFAAKTQDGDTWKDKYAYVTDKGLATGTVNSDDNTYWWVKLGDVSETDDGQRTVTLDTGILGTDQYNTGWKLDPDDFPENPVKTELVDRGVWTVLPTVVYTGTTGTRIPDGTLDDAIATALGWTGEEPLAFTQGQDIAEPYHYQSLTRLRWLTARLLADNNSVTDADLYAKLTTDTHGWEPENTLEISRVWNGGKLWECLMDNPSQAPRWGTTQWQVIGGNTTYVCEIVSSDGTTFRNGNVDTVLTMNVTWGDEDVTQVMANANGSTIAWTRYTGWDSTNKAFIRTEEDRAWTAVPVTDDPLGIVLTRSSLGSGWMTDYRRAMIRCTIYAPDGEAYPANYITAI